MSNAYPLDRASVATDGFVLFDGEFYSAQPDPEIPLPWVRAADEAGDEVPGRLKMLRADPGGALPLISVGNLMSHSLSAPCCD